MTKTHTKDFHFVNASGEATALPIVFREDGYINMTKAAKAFGKDLKEFWDNKATKQYVAALSQMGGIPPNIQKEASKGRNGGTFCHPKLAVFFARWLDVRFAVWCDLMIDNILKGNIQTQVAVPTKEALEVQAQAEKLKARVLALEDEVKRLQEEGLKEGEIPSGWMTAWNYLEDQGHSPAWIRASVSDFGQYGASVSKRRQITVMYRKNRAGSRSTDLAYYAPEVLSEAYALLLEEMDTRQRRVGLI